MSDTAAVSRAFVKEDVDPPERSGRVRSASGLPPGAVNYMTAAGAERLRRRIDELRGAGSGNGERITELERVLASATIVQAPSDPQSVAFGARVTVREAGQLTSYRIVGVDEVDFYSDAVSWISPVGKALLAADMGERITLENDERVELITVEYPVD